MSELQKATLLPINEDGTEAGPKIDVQFNPSSLRLQLTNHVSGGETRGKQQREYTGSSSTTLTVQLIFDTADEGTTEQPRSVREKTVQVEQFVYPRGKGKSKHAPPMVRFQWGDLILEGVVESVSIDLDHFAPNGYPLRAQVDFSFKEQDRKYQLLARGPGANQGGAAPFAGQASLGAVGSFGAGFSAQASLGVGLGAGASIGFGASASFGVQAGLAIGGESAAEFAARVGVDPAAWRGLEFDASAGGGLSLAAGVEVGFSAGLSASAGVGVFTGASAGVSASLEGAFGLKAEVGVTAVAGASARAEVQQGFTLAAAGGMSAAVESVKIAKSERAVGQAKAAFLPSAERPASQSFRATGKPSMPLQSRAPLRRSGLPTPAEFEAVRAVPAPAPPVADRRAESFGAGVPLRPTIGDPASQRAASLQQCAPQTGRRGVGEAPIARDPTTPPWVALPARDPSHAAADAAQKHARKHAPCVCAGPSIL